MDQVKVTMWEIEGNAEVRGRVLVPGEAGPLCALLGDRTSLLPGAHGV